MAEERFHIAEWYGQPFHQIGDWDRVRLAQHKVGGATMSKVEVARLAALEEAAQLRFEFETEMERLKAA